MSVSPPDGPHWRSSEAMTPTAILEKLSGLGCHSTDITDALYEADPGFGPSSMTRSSDAGGESARWRAIPERLSQRYRTAVGDTDNRSWATMLRFGKNVRR